MLDLVTIYDIFTCKEMPYNNTLRSLREVRFCFLFFFFFFFWLEKLIPELELATFHLKWKTLAIALRQISYMNGGSH